MYIDLLLRWNARVNLTAVREADEIVTRHFGESLFLARHLFPEDESLSPIGDAAPRVFDIGSGAGFPGLPLKMWAPHIALTLVESNHKKAAFLREVACELKLTNVNVITDRAETLAARIGPEFPPADVVTLRAVGRFDGILPIAARLAGPSGRLGLLIGSGQLSALPSLAPGFRVTPPIAIPQSQMRVLAMMVR